MKIDNSNQLKLFIKSLYRDISDQEVLEEIESIINIDRLQKFSKKMLLLQWYFYQDNEDFQSDQKMYNNALRHDIDNGLMQRFSIEKNLGLLKDDWGKESARSEMRKMAKQGILIKKDMKNYVITKLGEICSNFLYFKILESLLGVKNIWKLIKSDVTKIGLRNIDPNITINDLENWFVIEKQDEQFKLTQKFITLIDFLRAHPELYPYEFNIILDNLYLWVKNSIILNLDKKNVRLTISDNKIKYFKEDLKKVDWIFKIGCKYKNSEIKLSKWANSFETSYPKLSTFLNKCLIITAPPGYGKSILTFQISLELLADFDTKKIIPLHLNAKYFSMRSGRLYYKDYDLFSCDKLEEEISEKNKELFDLNMLGAVLSDYNPNQLLLKIFHSVLMRHHFILILDGWDELGREIQPIIAKYLKFIIFSNEERKRQKILITSRFLDNFLNSLIPNHKKPKREKERVATLELPKSEDIEMYLRLSSPQFKTKQAVEDLMKSFRGVLSPLDLFLISIFPLMNIPKYKSQLFERWIYYQVLSEVLKPIEFKDLKSEEDVRIKLETLRLKRNLDDKSFYLAQLINGTLIGNDGKNYSLMKILPIIAYSYFRPNIELPIEYLDAINSNPLLKRFIRPFYKGFQSYAQIADTHFYAYLIAKYTFSQFIKDQPIEPIPYPDIEEFIMEFYLQNSSNPKIVQLGIKNPEHFVCYLYLQSGIILPSLQLPYNYGAIFSFAWYSESIKYGVYLLRAFQHEFTLAIEAKDEKYKQRVLETFNKYRTEMPTRTMGSYQDEYSHELEVGEPQINHTPIEYFEVIAELFGFNPNLQKSKQEIDYLNIQDQYLDTKLGFTYAQYYWKRDDVSKILQKIFDSLNPSIIPWFAKILPILEKRQIYLSFNGDLIIERYKTQEDEYIKSNLLSILISSNPEIALRESQLFLRDDNVENLDQLIDLLCTCIKKNKKITQTLLGLWINFYKNPIVSVKQQYKLVRILYDLELENEQIIVLCKIYKSGNNRVRKRNIDERLDDYINIDEDPKELNFIFNCLIILNYREELKKIVEDKYELLGEHDLLLQYALEKRRFYYIALIRDSGVISDKKLINRLSNLRFEFVFSYSRELFQSLRYNVPYFKRIGEYLSDTHEFLLDIQKKWLEEKSPSNIYGLEKLLENIFEFYKNYKDTWQYYTDLGGAYVCHRNDETNPEMIQIRVFFDISKKKFPGLENEIGEFFISLVRDKILSKFFLEKKEERDYFYNYFNYIPNFISYAFKRIQSLPSKILLPWVEKLIQYRVPFEDFRNLISSIKIFTPLNQSIWDTYGNPWIGEKNYYFRKRPYRSYQIHGEKDEHKLENIVFLLPFDLLHKNLKQSLNWENLEKKYTKEVYNLLQYKVREQDEKKELIEKFGKKIQLYTLKLTEIAQHAKYEEKALKVIANLWEKYYIYPLVYERDHPSYNIYWNLVGDIPQKVYNKINDPFAKIFLNLCRFERYCSIYQNRLNFTLLNEFKTFKKEEIERTLILIAKSDWRVKHKFLLMLFSHYSIKILPLFMEIYQEIKEEFERTLRFYSKPREKTSGIKYTPPRDPPRKRFPFDEILQNQALFEENILKNYILFLSLLHHKIPDTSFIESIFRDYSLERFEETLERINQLPLSNISFLLNEVDEKKIINKDNFDKIKRDYMIRNKQDDLEKKNNHQFYTTPFSKILYFFAKNSIGKTDEYIVPQYAQISPLNNYEEIKDPEINSVIEQIEKGEIESKKVIEIISSKGINQDTTTILMKVIPFFHIDSWDDSYEKKDTPKIIRVYQRDIFWFLVELIYDNKKYDEMCKKRQDDKDSYYNNFNDINYYFKDDLNNYVKRLIFDGIQHNNLMDWYSHSSKIVPRHWIEENVDPIIIKQVFLPSQIQNIPIHLREQARRHAWKYMILPDLLNKVEQYFEGYRNTFPESEEEYIKELDDIYDDFNRHF